MRARVIGIVKHFSDNSVLAGHAHSSKISVANIPTFLDKFSILLSSKVSHLGSEFSFKQLNAFICSLLVGYLFLKLEVLVEDPEV